MYKYLTIIRRRRSEYWWIFPETKSRGIFTNIHEPEANNCFSIITQVIIEIPKQKNVTILPQFAIVDKSSYHAARINVSRNPFLNSRSGKRKHFLWRSYRVKINQNVVSWSVLLSTMGTLHYSFSNNVFLLLLRVERVCKSFWKESWRVEVVICIMQRVHLQVGVGVFNCQQILTKISFVIFNIVV